MAITSEVEYRDLYIDGAWRSPASADRICPVEASTGVVLGSVPAASPADADLAVAAARRAFDDPAGWSSWTSEHRRAALYRFADALDASNGERSTLVTRQNGMPIGTSNMFEGPLAGVLVRYYADIAAAQTEERRAGAFGDCLVSMVPVGVIAAVVPWNFPQVTAFVKIAPALAAGCTLVLKPSPETVLDAFVMADAASKAGLPDGVLNIVPGGRELGAYLVSHPSVDKVSFTGSTLAGRSIGQACGALLRPVTLELGGKSAAIILDDADLESNLDAFLGTTMQNNGQTCWLNTRILSPRSRYTEIVDAVTDLIKSVRVGDPLDPDTVVGPLVSSRQRERVEGYIAKGRAEGARVTTGGGRPAGLDTGWFVEPTVFADVDNGHTIAREEIFGPVLAVIPYGNDDEAVAIANDSEYGLHGSVWTADLDRGEAIARRIQTGSVGLNGYNSDLVAPFGGVKNSGYGRNLGPEGLADYQVTKAILRPSERASSTDTKVVGQ